MQEGGGEPAPLEDEQPKSGSLFNCINRSWAKTVWGIITEETPEDIEDADETAATEAWRDSEEVVEF